MTPAVFLDRDGTLIEEAHYLDRLERMTVWPWTFDALRLLARAGLRLVLVTNQSGVARGLFDEAFVGEVHRRLGDLAAAAGARIDGFYYCPHHPEAAVDAYRRTCDCRKPKTGLIRQAVRELDLDLARSFLVGDQQVDMELAAAAGIPGVLVGDGSRCRAPFAAASANLIEAAGWILRRHAERTPPASAI